MTIDEMFNELENKVRDTVIVTLKYKYDFEESYTIENHILEYDALDDSYFWLNDWYEGQTDIEVLGYMPLGDVDTTKLLICEDCRNCKKWDECPCGKEGHENETSIGYSIGECKEYEPCKDVISRAEILKYAQLIRDDEGIVHEMVHVDDIKDAPSVTWSGWKSVTEELPEPNTAVLLYVKYKSSRQRTYQLGMWNDNKQAWEDWRTPYQLEEEFEVVAWMELPEKYEEDTYE